MAAQRVNLNMVPNNSLPQIHLSQGDIGRQFVLNLVDSSTGYEIPAGATVTVRGTKPSGMGYTVAGTVNESAVTVVTTADMTDEFGMVASEVVITSGGTVIGSTNFVLAVEKDPHPAGTIDGRQESLIPELTLLVERVEAAAASVHDLSVSATTLAPGSAATATYDDETNQISFGIPRGADGVDGEVTQEQLDAAVDDLKSDINDVYDNTIIPTMTDGYYIHYSNGVAVANSGSSITEYIEVEPNCKYRLRNLYISGDRSICWYKDNGYGGELGYGSSDTEKVITIPSNAISIRATARSGEAIEIHKIGEVNARLNELSYRLTAEEKSNPIKPLEFEWELFKKPSDFLPAIPFNIYTDGHNFLTDFEFSDYKNTGGVTYYVRPNANYANDGLSRTTATAFSTAYSAATNGDTIVLLEGDYDRNSLLWGQTIVQKNINVVGEGKCRIFSGQLDMAFTKTSGYTNVYHTTRSDAVRVIDYKSVNDKYLCYELKGSVADVDAVEGSCYIDDSTVYVHAIGNSNPSALVCVTVNSESWLNVNNANQNTNVTFQNIELIGKAGGVIFNKINTSNTLTVICDNVRLYHCGKSNSDSFIIYGGNVIFNNCKAKCSYKDGFNYNGNNMSGANTDCFGIEIDCEGSSCGLLQSAENNNGSTGHNGAKMLRINCTYYDNYGANVADVNSNTMSINLGCKAFDSSAPIDGTNENFSAQQAGVTMWLYGCVGVGAKTDIHCVSGSVIHLNNCIYEVKDGLGTIEEQGTMPFGIYTLYKISEMQ